MKKLNPLIKDEGDIFFHQEYNKIVDVVNTNADELQRVVNAVFPLELELLGTPSYVEIGSSVSVKLDWKYNFELTEQYLDGAIIPITLRTKTITGVNKNTTWKVKGISNALSDESSFSIKFTHKIYVGSSSNSNVDNAGILAFPNQTLQDVCETGKKYVSCSGGKYIYVAVPTSYVAGKTPHFLINDVSITDITVTNVDLRNQFNYISAYKLYKLNNLQHGTSIMVELV